MKRLTAAQLAPYRAKKLAEQGGRCALCGEAVAPGEEVTDHDHASGEIRGVLHRGCNAMLGHLENNRARNKLTSPTKFARFLANIASYLAARREDPVYYPTHRTPDEKRDLKNKRARAARAAIKKGNQ